MAPVSPAPWRITLVEDDASLLNALAFALEADRYVVASYDAPAAALAERRDCDCLVVDMKLPGMDGLTLIERMRAAGILAPAILITSNPDARCRHRAAEARVPIVEKPLLGAVLRQQIADAIGRSPGA
jgi:DNA-binding response OmpR family regulator